jgi:hypothetical protein
MTKKIIIIFSLISFGISMSYALAQNSYLQTEQERSWSEAQKGYEQQQKEMTQEQMKDRSHDGRLKVDPNTSVSGGIDPVPNVNVKRTW